MSSWRKRYVNCSVAQIEVIKPLARCHPQSVLPVIHNGAMHDADSTFPKRIFSESFCLMIVFNQCDDRRTGKHPEIAGLVCMEMEIVCGQAVHGCGLANDLSCL